MKPSLPIRPRRHLTFVVSVFCWLALSPISGLACSICYGDPDAPVSKGLSWAILALIAVVMMVLAGVVSFFVQASRRAALLPAVESEETHSLQNSR